MPDTQGRFEAKEELFYVTKTPPSTATDPSGYTRVGLVTTWNFTQTAEQINAVDKDAAGWQSAILGTRSYTVNVGCNRKGDGTMFDEGQDVIDELDGETVYWLKTSNEAGDKCWHGQAVVSNVEIASDAGNLGTITFTLTGQGQPTVTTVPAA